MKKIKKKNKGKAKKIIISLVISMFLIVGFLFYGPWHGFRDFWITTAMTTLSHQYLATWLYSDKTINKVLESNKIIEPGENSDIE